MSAEPPWPGASTRMTSWSVARSAASGPQQRPVWVKPWTRTIGGPSPCRSAWRNMRRILAEAALADGRAPDRLWSDVHPMASRPEDLQATFCATLVDEWVRCGVEHAVICPGSRSTPLALALAGDGRIELHVHHDERSAGFLAVGLALGAWEPTVVLTTSGTRSEEHTSE